LARCTLRRAPSSEHADPTKTAAHASAAARKNRGEIARFNVPSGSWSAGL
jgi:hypothetical protein